MAEQLNCAFEIQSTVAREVPSPSLPAPHEQQTLLPFSLAQLPTSVIRVGQTVVFV